jgi:hypothetical protein
MSNTSHETCYEIKEICKNITKGVEEKEMVAYSQKLQKLVNTPLYFVEFAKFGGVQILMGFLSYKNSTVRRRGAALIANSSGRKK